MIVAMGFIAAGDALGKSLTQSLPVVQVLWVRSWAFFAVALGVIAVRGRWRAVRAARPVLQCVRSALLVIEMMVFMFSFRALPLAEVTTVAAVAPLVVTALAVVFLGERVGWRRWSAVGIGCVGAIIVARPGGDRFGWTMLLPLAGVLLWGIYQILARVQSRYDRADTSLFYSALIAVVLLGLVAPWHWVMPDPASWVLLLLLGLVNSAGHLALLQALSLSEASALQPFSYTMIAWAVLFGWWAFADLPDPWTLLGTALIVVSGLYAFYRERRLRPQVR